MKMLEKKTQDFLLPYKDQINWSPLEPILKEREERYFKESILFKSDLSDLLESNSPSGFTLHEGAVKVETQIDSKGLHDLLFSLSPWRKGPYCIGDLFLDAEWRSDLKWRRVFESGLDFRGKKILDIGSNNGHFLFHLSTKGPEMILGIDPITRCLDQFHLIQFFAQEASIHLAPLGVEHIGLFPRFFDYVCSMGILYHHRDPLDQLKRMNHCLHHKGTLLLETLFYPGEDSVSFTPPGRYANMRNVWHIPTLQCLTHWVERSGFHSPEIHSTQWEGALEQRSTPWSKAPSYESFLDPKNSHKTTEGHPAPQRVLLSARKKS